MLVVYNLCANDCKVGFVYWENMKCKHVYIVYISNVVSNFDMILWFAFWKME